MYCTYAINTASSATVVVSSSWIENRCIFNFSTKVFSTSFAILTILSFTVLLDRGTVLSLEATCVLHNISVIFTLVGLSSFPDGVRLFGLGNEESALEWCNRCLSIFISSSSQSISGVLGPIWYNKLFFPYQPYVGVWCSDASSICRASCFHSLVSHHRLHTRISPCPLLQWNQIWNNRSNKSLFSF